MHWSGSTHDMSDVGCMECHEIHSVKAEHLLVKNDPELCYECHQEQQSATLLPSHHPIPEGKMGCGDCHQVHGSIEDPLLGGAYRIYNDNQVYLFDQSGDLWVVNAGLSVFFF